MEILFLLGNCSWPFASHTMYLFVDFEGWLREGATLILEIQNGQDVDSLIEKLSIQAERGRLVAPVGQRQRRQAR